MASKNIIILHNNEFGTHKFSVLHSYEIFNRDEMVNLLEAIENKTYVYDDIIHIDISNLLEINSINVLPTKLKTLKIKNTTLNTLTIPDNCVDITEIVIKGSNLVKIPEIHFLTKLTNLTIENSNISKLPSGFPPNISNINLSGNSLNEKNCDLTLFAKNLTILLFNNLFKEKKNIPGYTFCYGGQRERPHIPITNYSIQRGNAHDALRGAVGRGIRYENIQYNPNNLNPYVEQINLLNPVNADIHPIVKEQTMFNSTQTVHISSICNSVTKSIKQILELTNDKYIDTNKQKLINEMINEFYGVKSNKNKTMTSKLYDIFTLNITNNEPEIKGKITMWVNDTTIHTKTGIKYGELLARIWILVKNHKQKNDFIDNIKIELNDSIGMCFTGRLNRLVNSLVGFIDGITVGISVKEQLQLEIGKIIAKLSKKEMDYDTASKEISNLFEDPDVKEDETVTSYYKQAWLDALEDYKPELEPEAENELNLINNLEAV